MLVTEIKAVHAVNVLARHTVVLVSTDWICGPWYISARYKANGYATYFTADTDPVLEYTMMLDRHESRFRFAVSLTDSKASQHPEEEAQDRLRISAADCGW